MKLLVSVALVVCLSTAACGTPAEPLQPTAAAGPGGSEVSAGEGIAFGESLAQIRGHLLVALELYELGEDKAAWLHARRASAQVQGSVGVDLETHDPTLRQQLTTMLRMSAHAIADEASAHEVSAAVGDAAYLTHRAVVAVLAERAQGFSYKASVIATLVATAARRYKEAVGRDGAALVPEFEAAYAFVQEAQRIYPEISFGIEERSPKEAEDIAEAFERLEAALPSPELPARLAGAGRVTSAAALIARKLQETAGAAPATPTDGAI